MANKGKSVLFICLGNICRSPMAEAVFRHLIENKGVADQWKVDSAALGPWHVGNGPDTRTMKTLQKNNVTDYTHVVRELRKSDFIEYEYIFGMDDDNMSELEERKPKNCTAKVELLGEYDPEGELVIRDPYYDPRRDLSGFEKVYEQCLRCCTAFLEKS